MPDAAKAVEAVCMLDAVLELFGPAGEHWMRGRYHDPTQGRFCLVGAMNYLQRERRIAPGASEEYLHAAIWPRGIPPGAPDYPLVWFNDNGRRTFEELRTVIEKARTLAQRAARAWRAGLTARETVLPAFDHRRRARAKRAGLATRRR